MRKMMDSGLDIVGQMPNEWNFVRLRYLCNITTGNSDTQDADPDGEYLFYVRSPIIERSTKYTFDGEGILMAGDGAGAGRVFHHAFGKYAVHQRVYRLYNFKINSNFLFYYVSNLFPSVMDKGSAQSTVPSVRLPMLLNFEVCTPPLAEQQRIADFLDEKCGEIDSIRSDIQKQIDILNDYKKSVITEAVTKGLNPKAKLKDSGIEWIGKIPEHWEGKKIKYLCSTITDGSHFSPETTQEGKSYITVSNVYNDVVHYENAAKISEEDFFILVKNGCRPPKGAVLLAKDGTVGRSAIVKENDYVVLSSLGILVPNVNKVTSAFLKYLLDCQYLQEQMKLAMAGSALRRITISKIGKLNGIVPPLPEQKAIAEYLDEKCSEIDATIADKQKQLETLDEYKKSLIFEYVTGKKEVPA